MTDVYCQINTSHYSLSNNVKRRIYLFYLIFKLIVPISSELFIKFNTLLAVTPHFTGICSSHKSHSVYIVPSSLSGKFSFTDTNRLSYRCPTQADFPGSFSGYTRTSLIMEREFRGKEQSAGHSSVPCSSRKPEDRCS